MKKLLIIFLGLAIGVLAGGAIYFRFIKTNIDNQPEIIPIPTPDIFADLETWEDQSEFTFTYPSVLSFNPHDEDTQNYAHIELTKEDYPGNIILWCKDSSVWQLSDWLEKNEIESPVDTYLGGKEAVKSLTATDSGKRLIVSTIRGGYLYQIEADLDEEGFWQRVVDHITSSYSFIGDAIQQSASGNTQPAAGIQNADIVLEEEFIE